MTKITCHNYDCLYNNNGKCRSRKVEIDSDLCRTYVRFDRSVPPLPLKEIMRRRDENAKRVAGKIRAAMLERMEEELKRNDAE